MCFNYKNQPESVIYYYMDTKKIGRNDPCPCGSGKKYKHCCQRQHQQASPLKPDNVEPAIRKAMQGAWVHHQYGRLNQAEAVCQKILQLKPKQADALHLLGIIALQNGDIDKAVLLISKAINVNPANPEYYNNLGFALHEQGKLDEAIKHYRKAITMKPDYANAHYNLHALLLNADMPAAIESMKKVVELQPLDTDARFILGVLLEYSGNVEAAKLQFDLVAKGENLYRARLDAWKHLSAVGAKNLPMTGSIIDTFKLAMNTANSNGLVLEFGVRFGNSIRQIASLVKQEGSSQKVHGFDSFEGLPEVWYHEPKGSYTTKGVIPSVPQNIQLHAGWFEDTLPKFLEQHSGPIRFINVDCDIYNSTKTVLELLAPRIVPGTVIVFDEYIGNEHWREDEFKAFQEAVAHNGWKYEYLCFSVFTKQVAVRIIK